MGTTTTNYGLTKPAPTDRVDITVLDADLDIIDTQLHNRPTLLGSCDTNATVSTVNVEWNVAAYALPLDVLEGDAFELECWGMISNTSGVQKAYTPHFRVGDAVLSPASQFVLDSSSNPYYFRVNGVIVVGVGNRINFTSSFNLTGSTSNNWSPPVLSTSLIGGSTSSADTAPGALVSFSMQPSSSSQNYTLALSSTFKSVGHPLTRYVYNGGGKFIGAQQYTMQSPSKEWSYRAQGVTERLELRSGDYVYADTNIKQRVEWAATGGQFNPSGQDVWVSYGMFIEPGTDSSSDVWCLLGQIHQTSDVSDYEAMSPPFSINFEAGTLMSQIRADSRATTPYPSGITTIVPWSIPNFPRGVWSNFVHHIKFSWTGAGTYECWQDGNQLYSSNSVNVGYNDTVGGYWKYGIYRANAAETLAVRYANMEVGTTSLADRITNPLAIS